MSQVFSWDNSAKEYINMYSEVIGKTEEKEGTETVVSQ